jgi:hypothetical protein
LVRKPTVIVCGMGALGLHTVINLANFPGVKIIAGDINEDYGSRGVNLARELAHTRGSSYPDLEFVKMDLRDVDGMTKILEKYSPDIVCQTACTFSWYMLYQLPPVMKTKLDEQMAWIYHLMVLLPYKLALAMKQAGLIGKVPYVQTSFPDVDNVVFHNLGMTPTCGVGNTGNVISRIRVGAARRLGEPVRDVEVLAVFAHRIAINCIARKTFKGMPCYVKVSLRGEDVTDRVGLDETWREMPPIIYGREGSGFMGGESAARLIRGLLYDTNDIMHVPGPNGLPGGYPVRVNCKGVEVILPKGLTMDEALRINREGNRLEGVDSIGADGTVTFTDEFNNMTKELLGFDCKSVKIREVEERAKELSRIFSKQLESFKIPVGWVNNTEWIWV